MGPVQQPPVPIAWRTRIASPTSPSKIGLELIGRTNPIGQPVIYWGKDCAECYKLAEADGWQF